MERKTNPAAPASSDLLGAVRRLYAAMNRFDHRSASELGIHPSDLRCLNALEHGGRTPSALGHELDLSSGSMTALLDRLERAGFVHRERAPGDRRSVLVAIRPEAYRRIAAIYEKLGASIESGELGTSPQRSRAAVRALKALADAFDTSER